MIDRRHIHMKRKRDEKTIQLGFKTQKEYDKFHKNAVLFYGDCRLADCAYLRECIKQNTRRRKKSSREKAKALVETTQRLNDLMLSIDNPYMQDEIEEILKEMETLWEF